MLLLQRSFARPLVLVTCLASSLVSVLRAGENHADDEQFWSDAAALLPGFSGQPAAPGPSNQDGQWGSPLIWPHVPVSAATLPNGKLVTYSGQEPTHWPGTATRTYTAVWDPATGTFDEEVYPDHEMFCAALVMRTDGVLQNIGGRYTINHSSTFDFRTNRWQRMADSNENRWYPTAVALPDGDVFQVSGAGGPNTAERYSREQNSWSLLTGIDWSPVAFATGFESNFWPYLFTAPDGRLFHFGPTEQMHWVDPEGTGSRISAAIDVPDVHYPKHAGVVMYDSGKILVAGGAATATGGATNKCYTVDLNTDPPSVQMVSPMAHPRRFSNAVVLPSGEVLIAGGNTTGQRFSDNNSVLTPEIWNPVTDQWREVADIAVPRNYHSVGLLLPDGRVFLGGGGFKGSGGGSWNHLDAQLYTPPSLFDSGGQPASRPVISSCPDGVATGSVFEVNATAGMHRFAAIRMMAVTHGWSTDQRRLDLPFAEDAPGDYRLVAHPNPNVMVPGYWMLFAIDEDGVYSEASILHVKEAGDESVAGLLGEYHDGTALSDLKGTRIDHEIDFDFGTSSPLPDELGDDAFSVRWTGWVIPEYDETYTFYTLSDEGVRLWIDGQQLVDHWTAHTATENSGQIGLSAGVPVPIVLEYYEATGDAQLGLSWASASTPKVVIPKTQFRHQDPAGSAALAVSGVHELYVDGELAGIGTAADKLYRTSFSAGEKATFAIRACNADALAAPFAIGEFSIGATHAATGVEWKVSTSAPAGWNLPGFDDSAWSAATNGGGVPAGIAGLPPGSLARQIWSSDPADDEVFLRLRVGLPKIAPLADRIDTFGDGIDLAVGVNAPPSSVLSFSATGLPPGLSIDAVDGQITGTLSAVGLFAPTITVADGDGDADSVQISWEVLVGPGAYPPVLAPVGDQAHTDGAIIALQLSSSDPDGDDPTYGQIGLPPGLFLDSESGLVFGTLAGSGSYQVTLWVDDGYGGIDDEIITWTVHAQPTLDPLVSSTGDIGAAIAYTAVANGGTSLSYSWNFGDGSGDTPPSSSASITHVYAAPGRYAVTLTVTDSGGGSSLSTTFYQNVRPALAPDAPAVSQSVIAAADGRVWMTNPDNDSVSVFATGSNALLAEISVGDGPRALAEAVDGRIWVSTKGADAIDIIDPLSLAVVQSIALPQASRPHGIAFSPADGHAHVVLEAGGQLLKLDGASGAQLDSVTLGEQPRHLSITPDGARILVSRFITPPVPGESGANPIIALGGGEVLVINAASFSVSSTVLLQNSTEPESGGGGRGVPNYLGAPAISPSGDMAWVPSKQDNIFRGIFRDANPLSHDTTVRAIVSRIDLGSLSEDYNARVDCDDASVPSAAIFGPAGLYVFVALEGSRDVAVIDAYGQQELIRFDTGRAPQGLAISPDGSQLYVHSFLDRSLGVFDVSALLNSGAAQVTDLGSVSSVSTESLDSQVLLGKQLFYDARDDRLSRADYMSCAACHNDGGGDGRVWDITGFGEGLRNTIDLRGRGGMGHGPLHWSANFDEVQDFENQIRDLSEGTGLITSGAPHPPLGTANAGRSADLDALAAYVASLSEYPPSPHRNADGSMTAAGISGRAVFIANNCASCHGGANFSDSGSGGPHDIGTLTAASGSRLGGPFLGIDTPTLRGLWSGAPYLHDGSAGTLSDAVAAHAGVSLDSAELADLVAYLEQIDDSEASAPAPAPPVISAFVASQWGIAAGENVTLDWTIDNGGAPLTALTLQPGNLDVLGLSSATLSPGSTTTYTLVATNVAGTDSAQLQIVVGPAQGSGQYPLSWEQWLAGGWGASLATTPGDDADSDGQTALLEYLSGSADTDGFAGVGGFVLEVSGAAVDAVLTAPQGITDVLASVELSADRVAWQNAGFPDSIVPLGGGLDEYRFSAVETSSGIGDGLGYARLRVERPAGGEVVYSQAWAWCAADLPVGYSTLGVSTARPPLFGGTVFAVGANSLSVNGPNFTGIDGLGQQLYAEILDGPHEGHRMEIDESASGPGVLALDLGSALNTIAAPPSDLAGARLVLRPHQTLGELLPKEKFIGGLDPIYCDRLHFYQNGGYDSYFLVDGGPALYRWVGSTDAQLNDAAGRIVEPGAGLFVQRPDIASTVRLLQVGQLRDTAFVQHLRSGFNLVGLGHPVPTSPAGRAMTLDNGFSGALDPGIADRFHLWEQDSDPSGTGYASYFLLDAGPGTGMQFWTGVTDGSLTPVDDLPLFSPCRAAFIQLRGPDHPLYRYPAP